MLFRSIEVEVEVSSQEKSILKANNVPLVEIENGKSGDKEKVKVTAVELINVQLEFVSYVTSGANLEDEWPIKKDSEVSSTGTLQKLTCLLSKLIDKVTGSVTKNNTNLSEAEGELEMTKEELAEILKANSEQVVKLMKKTTSSPEVKKEVVEKEPEQLKALTEQVNKLAGIVEGLLIKKEEKNDPIAKKEDEKPVETTKKSDEDEKLLSIEKKVSTLTDAVETILYALEGKTPEVKKTEDVKKTESDGDKISKLEDQVSKLTDLLEKSLQVPSTNVKKSSEVEDDTVSFENVFSGKK